MLKHKTQIVHTHLIPFFGDMRLDEILQSDVDAFARIELRRCARKTVNNRLAVLSTMLRYAYENRVIGKPTLRCHVGGSKAEDAPIVAVSAEDVEKLVAAADDLYRVVVLLAVEAGLRVGELRGAQWTDVAGGEIAIRRAIDVDGNVGPPKHNKVRRVPLSPRIVAALAALPKRGLWVLSSDDGSFLVYRTMLKAIRRLYKRAGVVVPRSETGRTMPFHSMRHTFGSECARRGIPVMTLRDLMGHEDVKTTQRYIAVTSADKRNAIKRAFGQQVGNKLPRRPRIPNPPREPVVGARGFEPPTSWSQTRCATRLRYAPMIAEGLQHRSRSHNPLPPAIDDQRCRAHAAMASTRAWGRIGLATWSWKPAWIAAWKSSARA